MNKVRPAGIYKDENRGGKSDMQGWNQMNTRGMQQTHRRWEMAMNLNRWMQQWQRKFDILDVQIVVADVAQSSLLVDVAHRSVVLSPSLPLPSADAVLERVFKWWQRQPDASEQRLCVLACR
jgi:hypothetical protein